MKLNIIMLTFSSLVCIDCSIDKASPSVPTGNLKNSQEFPYQIPLLVLLVRVHLLHVVMATDTPYSMVMSVSYMQLTFIWCLYAGLRPDTAL